MSDWTKENEWFDFKVIVCLLKYIHKNLCVCAQSCLTPCDPMTIACQALLSMECSRQEYWSGLPYPTPGNLPNPGIKPKSLVSPALADGFFTNKGKELVLKIHLCFKTYQWFRYSREKVIFMKCNEIGIHFN